MHPHAKTHDGEKPAHGDGEKRDQRAAIKSADIGRVVVCAVAGNIFAKTTGAQIPVDGGNDRVI